MKWMYGIIILFSFLTIYFTYKEYRPKVGNKRNFIIAMILEFLVIVLSVIQLLI